MFWGLIMEPNKRYTQTVEKSFHVSMASLDIPNADDEMVQVMLCYEGRNYLLCSLKKGSTFQVPLDLNFEEGTEIAFTCNGHGHVHLTGYLIPNQDLDELEEEEEAEEEDEEVPQLVAKQQKRKATNILNNQEKVKRLRQEVKAESSEDDSPAELDGTNEDNESEDSDEEDPLDELEVEEEDDSEDEEEDEEDEEVKQPVQKKPTKPQQQHDKKNKQIQQQQQQQQQKKKPEKQQKLVNGKEIKEDVQNKQQKKNKGEQQVQQQNAQSEQKKKSLEGGVQIEDIRVGQGTPAKAGKFISVYYVGRLKNGKKFDATTQGDGFKFRLGRGEVIKGWDIGIQGMKTGGKRRITIPPALAYGAKGSPPVIPGNSTLIFEVELRNVH